MKTSWRGTSLIANGKELHQVNYCIACQSNCRLVLPLNEEPPNICIKDDVNSSFQTILRGAL